MAVVFKPLLTKSKMKNNINVIHVFNISYSQ